MFNPNEFAITKAKPLPLYLLLDTSGSMGIEGKIEELNRSARELINSLNSELKNEVEILISIITFGHGGVRVHTEPSLASDIEFQDFVADGLTPMGGALNKAKEMIEDREITPSRAYRPTIVLMSDGMPTDNWESPLNSFVESGRSQKCDRMALSVGGEGKEVLEKFISGCEHDLFTADDAKDISKFFRYVTMSVVSTSKQNTTKTPTSKDITQESNVLKEQGKVVTLSNDDGGEKENQKTSPSSEDDEETIW